MSFERLWRELAPLGRSARSGGYFRQPLAAAERECHAWFVAAAEQRGLRVETDGFGNTVAWWEPEDGEPRAADDQPLATRGDAVLTGSHLDSVLDGGAFDGPLGVVGALAAVDLLRERGVSPRRPIGVAAFVEEEGSRFGAACLGSRLALGRTTAAEAGALADRDGVRLETAWARADLDPSLGAPWVQRVGCLVELHVEQGRDLVHRDRAVAGAQGIWPHGRYRFDFHGRADHAGTTRLEDRADPMLTYAMTVLAANKQARIVGARATFGRVEVAPNGTNAVPSRVSGWLDARTETEAELEQLVAVLGQQAAQRAERDGTRVEIAAESVSPDVVFDPRLTAQVVHRDDAEPWPVIATQAGHDAGVFAAAGVPTAMLFVRNPTGVSHSPAEHAETADCLAGVEALADALERLAG